MIASSRGDIVLVMFDFADGSGSKLRPALVISSPEYMSARREVVIAAVTSNIRRRLVGDSPLGDWQSAGLLRPSTVTGIIRTVSRGMLGRRLGALSLSDLTTFEHELRRALAL